MLLGSLIATAVSPPLLFSLDNVAVVENEYDFDSGRDDKGNNNDNDEDRWPRLLRVLVLLKSTKLV